MSDNEVPLAANTQALKAPQIGQNDPEQVKTPRQSGVPLNFSVEVFELLARAESDQASAMKLLEMLAVNLRTGVPLHPMLAKYIADAIESAAAKPAVYQARTLTDELHLTSQTRRPAAVWDEVGGAMALLIANGISKRQAKLEVAVEFDIDETTVLNYYKRYLAAVLKHDVNLPPANQPEESL